MKKRFASFVTLQRGFDLPKTEMCDGPFPVVGSTSIIGYHEKFKVEAPDVVTGRSGSLGVVQFIKERYWPHNTSLWVKDFKGNDPQFVYYHLKVLNLARFNAGAGVPTLNRNHLDTLELDIPSLPIQRKIAAILSAYDDLIKNSERRIKILEDMAQNLYHEWFVKFRFPGHEKVKMVNSPMGKIPEGWEVTSIGQIIETLGGGTPSTKREEYWDGGIINWYSPSDLTAANSLFIRESSRKITPTGLHNSSAKLFPSYSVMMTSRATIGVTTINTTEACTNQGFIVCIPNACLTMAHIYFWIRDNFTQIISVASGATFKEISRGEFRELLIILPPERIESEFSSLMGPFFKAIENLLYRNQNLRQTRDLLLPRLISGEVDVAELDITVQELNH